MEVKTIIAADLQEAHKQLAEILAKPEFGRKSAEQFQVPDYQGPSWNGEFPEEIKWGIYIFLGALVLVILIWLVRQWWLNRPLKHSLQKKSAFTKEDLLERAKELASRGEYRQAIRPLFQYILRFAADQRKLFLQIDKTNDEYRREIKETWSQKAVPFQQLSYQFDEIFYGEKQIDEDEYKRYLRQAARFIDKEEADAKG